MPEYRTPGVYVEELPGGARPIMAVGTSTTALVGRVVEGSGPVGTPEPYDGYDAFSQVHLNGAAASRPCVLATAVKGFFLNGGARLYVLRVPDDTVSLSAKDLEPLAGLEEVSLVAAPGCDDAESHRALMAHCSELGNRLAVLDMADGDVDDMQRALADGGPLPPEAERGLAAAYAPRLLSRDAVTGEVVEAAPSGPVCGVYAHTDMDRGVWKAPAGTGLIGVEGLVRNFSEDDQDRLSVLGINAIRKFPQGIMVWGARTLAPASSDWRYVPIRRLGLLIETSLNRGLQWVVFEPNDETLWTSVRRDVAAFLNGLWREGALLGATPDEAYFVTCDRTTMTQDDLDNGRLVCLVGVAAVKPAEFVTFRIAMQVAQA